MADAIVAYIQEVAAAMHRSLTMSDEEKLRRHQQLYKTVTTHTSHTWAAILGKKLLERLGTTNMARQTPYIPKGELERHYLKAKKRLFLFDYDVRILLRRFAIADCMRSVYRARSRQSSRFQAQQSLRKTRCKHSRRSRRTRGTSCTSSPGEMASSSSNT